MPPNLNLRSVSVSNVSQTVYSYSLYSSIDITAPKFLPISKIGPPSEMKLSHVSIIVYVYIYIGLKSPGSGILSKQSLLSLRYVLT